MCLLCFCLFLSFRNSISREANKSLNGRQTHLRKHIWVSLAAPFSLSASSLYSFRGQLNRFSITESRPPAGHLAGKKMNALEWTAAPYQKKKTPKSIEKGQEKSQRAGCTGGAIRCCRQTTPFGCHHTA